MKRNAIVRIILFSVLALVLTGVLIAGIAVDFFVYQFASGDNVPIEAHAPGDVRRLEIDWAAGAITISQNPNIDHIFFYEEAPDGCRYQMKYEYNEYSLQISYGKKYTVGQSVEKNLTIEVPANWNCEELELNAAGVIVRIENVDVHTLELNGAGCKLNYSGDVTYLDINSTGAELSVSCAGRPQQVDLNGMGCKLNLQLPAECGFSLDTSGLGCELDTSLPVSEKNGKKVYGDEACAIEVNGLGCSITITENGECTHVWDTTLFPTAPDMNILIHTCKICGIIKTEPDNHAHLWEEMVLDTSSTKYICSVCGITQAESLKEEYPVIIASPGASVTRIFGKFEPGDTVTYRTQRGDAKLLLYVFHEETYYEGIQTEDGFWEFTFTMPSHNVMIMALTEQEIAS